MREWLESNRVGPQRRLRKLHCPTCRKPARESDLGRIFVEAVVLDEDAEYQSRLLSSIAEQTNSARTSLQTITPTSSAVQVTRAISGVVRSQNALSTSQYSQTEPIVRTVTEVSVTSFGTREVLTRNRNCRKSQMTSKTVSVPCSREWRIRTRRLYPSEWRCVGQRSPGLLPTVSPDRPIEGETSIRWLREATGATVFGGGAGGWGTDERKQGFCQARCPTKGARSGNTLQRGCAPHKAILRQRKRDSGLERPVQ